MDNKPAKTKTMQPQKFSERDMFRTPRYATELLTEFLLAEGISDIWECAVGDGDIYNALENTGDFKVYGTDIRDGTYVEEVHDFLSPEFYMTYSQVIVTNPPFSLKKKFIYRALEYGKPFAMLIPADYSGWIIDVMKQGCEKIIPTRRIDYLTPNMLNNINDQIRLAHINKFSLGIYAKVSDVYAEVWNRYDYVGHTYDRLENVPTSIIRNYTSDFHSMWLTWGLHIGQQETYVDLTNEMKNRIF